MCRYGRSIEAELIIVECHVKNSKRANLVYAITGEIKKQCILTIKDYGKLLAVHYESCTILNNTDSCKCGAKYSYLDCKCQH